MFTTDALMQTDLPLTNRRQGKVRDIYEAVLHDGTEVLLIVATDRISAFDVVMANGIGGKGVTLTQLSRFWFDMIARHLGDRLQHHLLSTQATDVAGLTDAQRQQIDGRVMVGRKARVIPIECIVRGYLAGTGWEEYQQAQSVCGISLPPGLKQCERLPAPLFTPSTKAATGHDENISFASACDVAGEALVSALRDLSLTIYQMAHDHAAARGIILADTKFEFGLPLDDSAAVPILIDEVLTPDSSRFWPAAGYQAGRDQVSYDKQYVRNYLQELVDAGRWDKTPPGPTLPDQIVANTQAKYLEAYRVLTGQELSS